MCLRISKGSAPLIADSDITVYKVVKINGNSIFAPYQDAFLGYIQNLPIKLEENGTEFETLYYDEENAIEGGGFHSFHFLCSAITEQKWFKKWIASDVQGVIVLKCIIPKGTLYYKGLFEYTVSYCSKQLIIQKIVS